MKKIMLSCFVTALAVLLPNAHADIVVATDTNRLTAEDPGFDAAQLVGNWSGKLSNSDDENKPPLVNITSPANLAFFPISPTNLSISATATDPDGSVSRVDFWNDGTNLVGSALSAPFAIVWTNVPPGTNHLIAVATDDLGADAVSEEVVFVINSAPVVTMVSPTNETRFAAPANILIKASASDPDGIVTNVSFYSGGNWIGTIRGGPNFAMIWSNVPPSTNLIMAVAADNWGLLATSSMALVYVGTLRTNFADNFMYRGFLSGSDHFLQGTSADAMSDPGEPAPCAGAGRRTVWITWTAPTTGRCYLDTWGGFDIVLSVYTNDPPSLETITNLTLVDWDDDGGGGTRSSLSFLASAGTAYHVRIAGFGVSEGGAFAFTLHLAEPGALLAAPQNLNIVTVSGSQLAVSWDRSSTKVGGYEIERSVDGTNFFPVAAVGASNTVYLDTRLSVNTPYFYRLRAYDAYGPSRYTSIASGFTALPPSGSFAVRINFAPPDCPVPAQWEADDGAAFEDRGNGYSYGWDQDNSANSRLVGSGLSPYDSFQLMQEGGEDRVWEIAVPAKGYYIVHAVAGSPMDYDGYYRLWIESMLAIDGQPSAENRFLETSNIVMVSDGRLTVSCAAGAIENRLAFLEITAAIPAYFLNPPESRTSALGSFTTFNGLADGTAPLSYQWYKDGVEIFGATNASYSLTNLQFADAGYFSVAVSSPCGSVTSTPALLTIVTMGPDFFDTFEPGINIAQWSELSGAVAGPSSAGSTSGTNALLFGGQALRYAMTRPLNTSSGGLIDFQLRLSAGVVLPQEGVVLEFSTDVGNSWSTLRSYAGFNYTNWTRIRESIPAPAQTPNTLFRWLQTPLEENCCGTWVLDDVFILVSANLPPVIAWEPENQITLLKSNTTFRVAAVGTWPFSYQWRFNGADLIGQTNETLLVTNTTYYSQGDYSVVVCNGFGCATSRVAQLTADLGATVVPMLVFDFTNSWRFNQTEDLTSTGWYEINYDDSAWPSGPGLLAYESNSRLAAAIGTYLVDPRTPAPNLSIPRLYYFRSSFVYSNDIPIAALAAIIWMDDGGVIYFNGQPVNPPIRLLSLNPGYNDLTTARPPSGDGDAIGEVFYLPFDLLKTGTNLIAAEVHQEAGNSSDVTWGMALYGLHLESNIFPMISSQPASQIVDGGSTLHFKVTATGYPNPAYQWLFNGNPLAWRTSSILTLTNVGTASAGSYTVLVSNITGVVTSSVATLVVRVPATIVVQPQDQKVYAGTNVTLWTFNSGTSPLFYQWFRDGSVLSGQTNGNLVLSNIVSSMSGPYFLRVTNLYGSATSRVATIIVSNPAINTISMRYSNGVFTLPFSGCTLGSYTIDCSSNLVDWTTLARTNRPVQPLMYIDTTATNQMRFYRLIWNR